MTGFKRLGGNSVEHLYTGRSPHGKLADARKQMMSMRDPIIDEKITQGRIQGQCDAGVRQKKVRQAVRGPEKGGLTNGIEWHRRW